VLPTQKPVWLPRRVFFTVAAAANDSSDVYGDAGDKGEVTDSETDLQLI
jgi:hypothetical protein